MKNHLTFHNGVKMPIIGLGTFLASNPKELENALEAAIDAGYRHFDTAFAYMNEEVIGNTLKKCIDSGKVKREDLFIVTKLPMIAMKPELVEKFIRKSMKALQLDYIDLYLVHGPIALQYISDTDPFPNKDGVMLIDPTTNLEAIWKEMENLVDKKLAKSIGISNFNVKQVQRILNISRIKPANQQVELHAYFQQKEMREFCEKNNITIVAYAPLSSPGRKVFYDALGAPFTPPTLLEDPLVGRIAKKYNKDPGQILLRFLMQIGVAVIPKSTNPARVKSNFDVFDFSLTCDEMKGMEALDKGPSGRSLTFDFKMSEPHPEMPY